MIAHVCRFWPEYEEIKRLVDSGDFGRPVSALAYRRQPFPAWSALFSQSEMTGGAVVDMMIHDYDALNWILGRPRSVTGRGRLNDRSRGYDQVQVMIDYGDASALVDGGMMMPESYAFTAVLHVLCERGAFEYTFRAGGRSVEMGAGVNELRFLPDAGEPQVLTVEQHDPYWTEIAYFLDCVRHGKAAERATPADARAALQVALAAKQAVAAPSLTVVRVD
jgi:predicted dehydrogenase